MKRKKKTDLQKAKDRLWELCKQIVRARDKRGESYYCYTCDSYTPIPQTGHFIPSSVCSVELRYSLANLKLQCLACNVHKSGNWIEYEKRLTADNGPTFTAELKKKNEETKGMMYRIDWYQNKIEEYEKLLSTLR